MNLSYSGTWLRSVKRKFDEFDEHKFVIPGLSIPYVARVEIENECVALREVVGHQQFTIQDLSAELEEERDASSSAANEAMSMILRLQGEKAEIQMEARQFKRFSEEKMAHDQHELFALEDLLYKREQAIQSLTCEVQAYKHRMMSYGLTEAEAEGEGGGVMFRSNSMAETSNSQLDFPTYDYPPLKCNLNENQVYQDLDNETVDIEKYAFGETPRSRDHLKDLECRINQLENSPRHSLPDGELLATKNVLEKVIVGHSPRRSRHLRRISTDSAGSFFTNIKEIGSDLAALSPRIGGSMRTMECSVVEESPKSKRMNNASEYGDDMSDRVYTIDSIHNGVSYNGVTEAKASVGMYDDYITTPKESLYHADVGDPEIKKLYTRLQTLEADRESMRQTLISMRTDKAQLVLLKEIAQHLYKDMPPQTVMMPVKKPSVIGSFSFMSIFKCIVSFVFWRRKARRSKYMFGMSQNNAGLLMLLDKGPRVGQWRCLSSTQKLDGCFTCMICWNMPKRGWRFQETGTVNITMDIMEAFGKTLQTLKSWALQNFDLKTTCIIFRSYSPVHYRDGAWNEGGHCDANTAPAKDHTKLETEPLNNQLLLQIVQQMKSDERSVELLNITYLTELRKDGHPSKYREPGTQQPAPQDCSHWCLPGVPDTWNELLYAQLLANGFRI